MRDELNGNVGDEIKAPCPTCVGATVHEVIASVEDGGVENNIDWGECFQVICCRGCRTYSFRLASTTSEDNYQVSEDVWEQHVQEKLYPPRASGRRSLGAHARYLPSKVRQTYGEVVQALDNSMPILAGLGLRVLVETVCKEKEVTGKNLEERIDALAQKQITTPVSAAILHRIRQLGNSAAHEASPHSDKQLSVALDIVESMLTNVYIQPKLVEELFG